MKPQLSTTLLICLTTIFTFQSCKKDKDNKVAQEVTPSEVIHDFAHKVAFATYSDLEVKANLLYLQVQSFNSTNSNADLASCKQLWKDTRAVWEKNEAFLFGPVATEDMDPGIDDWPVNKDDLDTLLASNQVFTSGFLDSTQTTLKGFHPMEYLLFGTNGNKTASEFTSREKEYLLALGDYIKRLSTKIRKSWDPSESGNYLVNFTSAGQAGSNYATKRAALEELVNSMIGICEEVSGGKIEEPLAAQNPNLEESQFSQNSIEDFTNNMRSVQNAYFGDYLEDGIGLNKWVNQSNISLDNKVQQRLTAAINSFSLITVPFGQAIITQQLQLHQVQEKINELKDVLEGELLPYIQAGITD